MATTPRTNGEEMRNIPFDPRALPKIEMLVTIAVRNNIADFAHWVAKITTEPSCPTLHHHCPGRIRQLVFLWRMSPLAPPDFSPFRPSLLHRGSVWQDCTHATFLLMGRSCYGGLSGGYCWHVSSPFLPPRRAILVHLHLQSAKGYIRGGAGLCPLKCSPPRPFPFYNQVPFLSEASVLRTQPILP